MDPATIAGGLVALFAPYVKKAAESFAGDAGKLALEKAKSLWEKLRMRFAGDPAASGALEHFANDPEKHREELQQKLEEKVAKDISLAEELANALIELKRVAPYVRVVQEIKQAENLTAVKARKLAKGTVDVTQKAEKVGTAVAAEIDEIG